MKRNRFFKRKVRPLFGEFHAEDGVDPRESSGAARKADGDHRKAQQLCHQVADTLSLVLGGEFGEVLRDLRVVAVRPAPDTSQLLVLVAPAVAGDSLDATAVLASLAAAAGRLRAEVSRAITRKRAPKLLFQFVAGAETGPEMPISGATENRPA